MGKTLALGMFTLAATLVVAPLAAADEAASPVGKKIANFTAEDYRGKEVSLADFAGRDNLKTYALVEAAYESARTHQAVTPKV